MRHCLLLLLFISILPFIHSTFIGTGRGVLAGIQTSPSSYMIKEVAWDPYGDGSQLWELEVDDRFPNGVFIRNTLYDLVWDASGGKTTPGTPVLLWTKKDSLADTKNQRWGVQQNGKINVMLNLTAYVNVTGSGAIVLANSITNSQYQIFRPVNDTDVFTLTIENAYNYSVFITATGPLGPLSDVISARSSNYWPIVPGYTVTIKDATGNHVSPSPFTVSQDADWIRLPRNPFPSGAHVWKGPTFSYIEQVTFTSTANITFQNATVSGSGSFSGSGSDKYGAYTISGAYTSTNVRFGKVYASYTDSCQGSLDQTGKKMTGQWQRNSPAPPNGGSFEYNLQ